MLRFIEWPLATALIILLPLAAVLIFRLERRSRTERLARLGTRSMLARLAPLGAALGPGRTGRLIGALFLCGIAFMGPRWGKRDDVDHTRGVDVVLALDASLSMMAQDATPSRLEEMKNVVRQLRAASPDDRFALVGFAGHSYVFSPLTTDQTALDMYLTNLSPTSVGVAGTSIADALKRSTALLSDQKGPGGRVIILMSDGETFDPLIEATDEAKHTGEAGIRLITVGFGTKAGTTIPVRDSTGAMTVKKDAKGKVVTTTYMPSTLSQVALAAANGVFIPAEATNKAEQIRRILNSVTPSLRAVQSGADLAPQFQWFALGAVVLLMLDTLLTLRPRRRPLTMATAAAATTLAAACSSPPAQRAHRVVAGTADSVADSSVQGPFEDTLHIKLYNQGTKLLQQGRFTKAVALLDSAMESSDTMVGFRASFNDGYAQLVRGRKIQAMVQAGGPEADSVLNVFAHDTALRRQKAEDSIDVDSAGPGAIRQAMQAELSNEDKQNLALNYAEAQLDSAVEKYRQALTLHPTDRDAKWNYELALAVINRVQPPDPPSAPDAGGAPPRPPRPGKKRRLARGVRIRHQPRSRNASDGRRRRGKGQKSPDTDGKGKGKGKGSKADKGKSEGKPEKGQSGKKGGDGTDSKGKPQKNPALDNKSSKSDKKDAEGGGGGNKQGKNGNGAGKGYDRDGQSGVPPSGTGDPDVERLTLPPQQALQLLDAVGQHEQKSSPAIKVPTAVPPQGKDW